MTFDGGKLVPINVYVFQIKLIQELVFPWMYLLPNVHYFSYETQVVNGGSFILTYLNR